MQYELDEHPTPNTQDNINPKMRYRYTGYEDIKEIGVDLYDAKARLYDPYIGRFFWADPLSLERSWLNAYNYCQNSPVLRIDLTGLGDDWFENEETGALLWKDNKESSITIDGQVFNNVGKSFSWSQTLSDGNNYTIIGNENGELNILIPNEYGMVQFPSAGEGFSRYTGGLNDVYTVNGVKAAHGDNWAAPETAADLYNTIRDFHLIEPGINIHYGDISAYDPQINLGHKTHNAGKAIDIRYFDKSGTELNGSKSYLKADPCLINSFMHNAENHGFSKNYSYGNRFIHSGNNNHSIHKDHFHIGQ